MILNENLTPAEGEQRVKTYHCTSFRSKLLGIASEGYLEVTNKRVVFQAMGGDSIIHSEVPIEDVSGISVFKGSYFSIMHLIGALVLGLLLGSIASAVLGAIVSLVSRSNTILSWVVALGFLVGGVVIDRRNIFRPVCAVAAAVSLLMLGGLGVIGGGLFGGRRFDVAVAGSPWWRLCWWVFTPSSACSGTPPARRWRLQ